MKGKRWLHALVASIVAVFGALAIACSDSNDDGNSEKPFESPAIGVYYYEVGETEYLLSLNADKTLALMTDTATIAGKYDVNDSGAVTFTVTGADKLLNTAKYADDEVTLTYDGAVYKFLRRVDYTVTFNTGAGSKVDSATVRNGKKLTKPADPEYANHVFIGWYKDEGAKNAFKFSADVVRGDLTLYAGWVQKTARDEYNVKFDLGYGDDSLYATVTTVNGKVYAPEMTAPTRTDYAFKGWWIKDAESGEFATRVDLGSYEFKQNETLYALWQGAAEDGKLDAPVVSVDLANSRLSWETVEGAANYEVKVVDPAGKEWKQTVSGTSVEYAEKFTKAGTYTVEVYAVSPTSADKNSAVTTRKVVGKQLARVSNFKVTGDVLTFSGVEGATKYLLYIQCGDENHDHNPVDNGNSKEFNFGDCTMPDDGIKFVVEAQADGYVSSRSEEYTVARKLDKATGFAYDESTQTVSWSAVANATSYFVTVKCDNPAHVVETEVKNATSINVGECTVGSVKVSVVAKNVKKYIASDGAEYAVNKTEWAAVTGLALEDTTLTWKKQSRVKKYIVDVNGVTSEVTGDNKLDLSKLANLALEVGKTYNIKVRAELNSGELTSWSLPLSTAYKTMTELKYSEGKVSWTPVFGIGTAGYKVVVNDAAPVSVNTTDYKVTLTDKTNVIKVYIGNADVSTAKSVTVNAYKLTLDVNGGTGAADARYYAKGDPISLPKANALTRRGYNLSGWYTSAEGNSAGYYDGDNYDLEKDLTLYARWDGKEYTVRLNYNRTGDSTDEVTTVKVKFGSEYKLDVPTVPKSTIYGFMGWNRDRNGDGVILTGADGVGLYSWDLAENNITVYAVWKTIFEFERIETGESTYYIIRKSGSAVNALSEIVIPAEYSEEGDMRTYPVAVVGGNAFSSCKSLTKITIPSTVTTIEATAFNYCDNLQRIEITGATAGVSSYWSVDGVLYGIDPITERKQLVYYPHGRTGDYTIADGIECLPYEGLKGANINTLTIPSDVTLVSANAFSGKIGEIVFAEPQNNNAAVKTLNISSGAFKGMSGLSSITFPSRTFNFIDGDGNPVYNVDYKADLFNGCNSLASVNVATGNAEYISIDGMLCKTSNGGAETTIIFCPVAYDFGNGGKYKTNVRVTAIGDKAFSGVKSLREIEIGASITSIGDYAFSGYRTKINNSTITISACENLNKLIIVSRGAGLTIGYCAFGTSGGSAKLQNAYGSTTVACNALAVIELQDGSNITNIGGYAFAFCAITDFTLPETLAAVGDGAFRGCANLRNIEFTSDKDFKFGNDVFKDCKRLKKVVLPKNVTEFKSGVFAGCKSLDTIEVDPENPVLVFIDGILYGKENGEIKSIHFIPESIDIENFVMPEGITEISAGTFGNAGENIKKLTVGKSVRYIGSAAFAGTGIEEVIFLNKENADDEGADILTIEDDGSSAGGIFYNCKSLKRVVLPKRLTVLQSYMFSGCSALETIDFASVKHIGKDAFDNAGLSGELFIPKTVETIGYNAFFYCKSITSVNFEDDRTTDIAFLNANGEIDGLDVDNKFITGSSGAFWQCTGIVTVHLPERLVNIGGSTFGGCSSLTTINIPSTVKSIRKNSFYNYANQNTIYATALNNVTFAERTGATPTPLYLEDGNSYQGGGPSGSVSAAGVFQGASFTSIAFPNGTVRIPAYCFNGCKSLTTVTIPNTVRNTVGADGKFTEYGIGSSAFNGCALLTTLDFAADDATLLDNDPTYGLTIQGTLPASITSLTLPARTCDYSETALATGSFSGSSSKVASITVMPGGKAYTSVDNILYSPDGKTLLFCPRAKAGVFTIPNTVNKIGNKAFQDCKLITGFTFEAKPAEATAAENDEDDSLIIGDSAFNGCNNASFTSLTIPSRVTSIGVNAFTSCSSLTSITIEDGDLPLVIGNSAFTSCSKLTSFTIPNRVTSIGVQAFSNLKITSIIFSTDSKLVTIGNNAFEKTSITSVTLPDSVVNLGNQVFANCTSLTTASVPLTVNNYLGVFVGCSKLTSLTFREVDGKTPNLYVEDNGQGMIYNSEGVLYSYPQNTVPNAGTENEGVLTIDNRITTILDSAFAYNDKITKLVISKTVTKIGSMAFINMPNLTEVVFEDDDATSIEKPLVFEGKQTFDGCYNLTKVKLPARLQTLSESAFAHCFNLTEVTFADNCRLVSVPTYAFYGTTKLTHIDLPANVGGLGQRAFAFSGLTSVTIPASYVYDSTSNTYTFENCYDLTTVQFITPTVARNNVQTGNYMFNNCNKLVNVTLPDDLYRIGNSTFENCTALQEIALPESLKQIGSKAFKGCTKLAGINRDESDAAGTVNIPVNVEKIEDEAFYNCASVTAINMTDSEAASLELSAKVFAGTSITSITIPNNVKKIDKLFTDGTNATCARLESIVFEGGNSQLTSIPASLAEGMTSVKSVVLPTGLLGANTLTIGNSAFKGTSITSVVIPKETSKIDYSAFRDCALLTTVTFEKDDNGDCALKGIAHSVFRNSGLVSIEIPKSAEMTVGTSMSNYATSCFADCADLQSVVFETGSVITMLGVDDDSNSNANNYMFQNCTSLTNVVLPDSLRYVPIYVFDGCTALQSITLPTTVYKIAKYAFRNCTSLTSVNMGNQVIEIGDYAFQNCKSLESINLSAQLIEIGNYAFQKSALTSVTLPSTLDSIGNYAFSDCDDLSVVNFGSESNLSKIGNYAFQNTVLTTVNIPATVESIGSGAFKGCDLLATVTYAAGSNLRTIGSNAFDGCRALEQIIIPDGVREIGGLAFQNCVKVTTVTLPSSLRTMGTNPFILCNKLAEIIIPDYYGNDEYFAVEDGALYALKKVKVEAEEGETEQAEVEEGEEEEKYVYKKSKLVTFYDRNATSFILPEEVTEIGADAFWNMPIQTVSAEVDELVIGASAFRGSSINSITLGNDVSFGDYAFRNCKNLTAISINQGAELGIGVFDGSAVVDISATSMPTYNGYNISLEEDGTIVIYGKNNAIAANAFKGDTSLTKVAIAEGVTVINANAFSGCTNIASITLPSTLTTIGESAFQGMSQLSALDLPESLTSIGKAAFAGSGIESIHIPKNVKTITTSSSTTPFYNSASYVCKKLHTISFEGNTAYTAPANYLFANLPKLKTVVLPDKATKTGDYAFMNTQIESITLPATVTAISNYAFDGVKTFTTLNLSSSTSSITIGNYAFRNTGIPSTFKIPQNITTIGTGAFNGTSLSGELVIPKKVTTISASAFEGLSAITSVTFERNGNNAGALTTIDAGAFAGTSISSISIPENVTKLGATSATSVGTFANCTNLTSVEFLGTKVTQIGYNVFNNTQISSFVVPSSVTALYPAFVGSTSLTEVTINATNISSGSDSFANLTALTKVTINSGVKKLPAGVFSGCTGISELTLPSSITDIGDRAFEGWTSSQKINITGKSTAPIGFKFGAASSTTPNFWAHRCKAQIVWNYTAPVTTP